MIEYINLALIIIMGIALIIIGLKVYDNFENLDKIKKENFGAALPTTWLTQPLLMSDDDGNIFRDAKSQNSILKTYIDNSITNSESALQSTISTLEGSGYKSTTTLASLQAQIDTLNSSTVKLNQNIRLVSNNNGCGACPGTGKASGVAYLEGGCLGTVGLKVAKSPNTSCHRDQQWQIEIF